MIGTKQLVISSFLFVSTLAVAEIGVSTTPSIEGALQDLQQQVNTQNQNQQAIGLITDLYAISASQDVKLSVSANGGSSVTADSNQNPSAVIKVPADEYTISVLAQNGNASLNDNLGNQLSAGTSAGNFQPYTDMFQPQVVYTAAINGTMGTPKQAQILVDALWYGVGGPRGASKIFPTKKQAQACKRIMAAGKGCAKYVQMHLVDAVANNLTAGMGVGGGDCTCNTSGSGGNATIYPYDDEAGSAVAH